MTTQQEAMELSDLWLDANQGETKGGCAFGYIGTDESTTDADGDDCEYCGWFFTWPGASAKVTSEEQLERVVDSLETDETASHLPAITHALAEQRLRKMLEKNMARNAE